MEGLIYMFQNSSMFCIALSLIFGAIFGSFITAASYRLPRNENMFTRSKCPKCNTILKNISLIPIFSWIFQGGKCLNCKAKISIRYSLTEIITAILFLISYLKFGNTFNTIIVNTIIVSCMIMIVSDLETYIIPDSTQITLLISTIILIIYNKWDLLTSVISGSLYFLMIFITATIVEKWKKKDAIGGGDVKFITIAGMILGIQNLPTFFLFSGFIGVVFGLIWTKITKKEYFPFGPALILSYLFLLLK